MRRRRFTPPLRSTGACPPTGKACLATGSSDPVKQPAPPPLDGSGGANPDHVIDTSLTVSGCSDALAKRILHTFRCPFHLIPWKAATSPKTISSTRALSLKASTSASGFVALSVVTTAPKIVLKAAAAVLAPIKTLKMIPPWMMTLPQASGSQPPDIPVAL